MYPSTSLHQLNEKWWALVTECSSYLPRARPSPVPRKRPLGQAPPACQTGEWVIRIDLGRPPTGIRSSMRKIFGVMRAVATARGVDVDGAFLSATHT